MCYGCFYFSSRRRHTRLQGDWSSDVCSSDLPNPLALLRQQFRIEWRLYVRDRGAMFWTFLFPLLMLFGMGMIFRSDRKSTRLNSSHLVISYAVFCLKKKTNV